MERTRRDLLARTGATLAATGAVGAAGCLDFAAGDGPQGPEGTPETLSCGDDEFVRLSQPFEKEVAGTLVETAETTVELSAEGNSETYGQSLRLVLRNTGDEPATALGRHAYSVQRETAAGWLDVRGSTTGEAVELPRTEEAFGPTGAYSWSIDLDEEAIASAVPDLDLTVCPPLGPGTYRFVYWGIVDAPPLGAQFELIG
ncbi:hypothetical protein DJ82_04900 [Halorubrum sp. Ib24]|uniref:hypothetical protein n=1 Tax=unclassified Halorubrum TaxID=2642239 RepID=UPI000B999CEB|nr:MULTISPECIES: hypothetical protein [unclassified Halorubrum]OYR41494.1 hypothetical protein DJ82_04900 [Halorubrum sp. Ib24]OYR46111.1 hypothetical protein DJ81_03375 [Halorubrum sp. Hd13]OYR48896.1 hypothetical protein DJ75_02100 [Halorubrum sp. Eb13]OYR50684.1 hypothetical protein DJ73_15440 [Halorubrum sp. Ea1]OYR51851.1 hypothetical protein DJ74_02970 [Halorubrum sp. Ea8]